MQLRNRVVLAALALGLTTASGSPALQAHDERNRVRDAIRLRGAAGGYLGVQLADVRPDEVARLKLAEERGAIVTSVEGESPAEKAGIKADDVILRWQGEAVASVAQLVRLVRETPPGRQVALEVGRAGATQKLTATLGERPGARWLGDFDFDFDFAVPAPRALPAPPDPPEPPLAPLLRERLTFRGPRKLGVRYQEIEDQLAQYFKLSGRHGVLITHVDDGSPAARGGLKAGDVVLKLDGRTIEDAGDFQDAVRDAEPGSEIVIGVQREGKPLELRVKLEAEAGRRARGRSTASLPRTLPSV